MTRGNADRAVTVTVAICTRDRPVSLCRALDALGRQHEAADEIVVVDNAQLGETSARAAVEAATASSTRYLEAPIEGLDFARNRALTAARGSIVAFQDDDVVVESDWVAAIRRAFAADPGLGALTGRVLPLRLVTPGERLFEANGGFDRGPDPMTLPVPPGRRLRRLPTPAVAWAISVGCGSSLAVRRDLALSLGGFDPALDLGPALPGGGDHDLVWRVLEAGYRVRYEPAMRARHAHRQSVAGVCAQIAGHQRGLIAMLAKTAVGSRRLETAATTAAFLAWRLLKPGARLARRALGRDPLPALALARMWWHCWLGLPGYWLGRRIARRRAAE